MNFPLNPEITYFARTNFRGTDQIFGIKRKDRRQHTYVLGKSGTGKSVMLENMIIQNIKNGEGVCVVDPHGELAEKILESIPVERANDVVYFNPADTDNPIGFNVLQLDDVKYKHLVASGLMGIFTKIWANVWSSRMEYILSNAVLALLDSPDTTLLGIPRLLVDKDYRQYIINNLKDPVVKAFWVHEFEAWRDQFRNEAIAPIQNKVGQFLSSAIVRNVVGQSKSTVNIFNIMNEKKIFIVNVSKGRIGEDNSALLGGMIITKIQLAAMERVRIAEQDRKDFYLYIDEFQNFSTESFGSILSEARKYRLCLIIAHQYTAQLDETVRDAVFGNVGTMIIFRVGADDADTVEKEFDPEFAVEDFVNLPNYHIYTKLMVDGVTSRPFSAKTLPPIEVDTTPEIRQEVIETSRKLYTKPREIVETEIERWSTTVPGQKGLDEGDVSSGKFKVECSNDKKMIYVPFEPAPGVPVYCKECLFKIKTGELEPLPGYRAPREKKETISYDSLAALGIEFANQPTVSNKPIQKEYKKDLPQQKEPSKVFNPIKSFGQKIQSAVGFKKPLQNKDPVNKIKPVNSFNNSTKLPFKENNQNISKTDNVAVKTDAPKIIEKDTVTANKIIAKEPIKQTPFIKTNNIQQKPNILPKTNIVQREPEPVKKFIPNNTVPSIQKKPTENVKTNNTKGDNLGLKEILESVTLNSHVKNINKEIVPEKKETFFDPFKDTPKVEVVPEKTMSLADLLGREDNNKKNFVPKKDTTEDSKNMLINALSLAKKENIDIENKIEEKKEIIPELKTETEIKTEISDTELKEIKEIPEDVLRSLLE